MGFISGGWRGDEELWKVFWIYGAFLIFMAKVASVVFRLTLDIDFDNTDSSAYGLLVWIETFYGVWLVISLWQCAFNAEWRIWGYLLRAFIILCILMLASAYFMGGVFVNPWLVLNKLIDYLIQLPLRG